MKLAGMYGIFVGLIMAAQWIFVLMFAILLALAVASVFAVAHSSKKEGQYA